MEIVLHAVGAEINRATPPAIYALFAGESLTYPAPIMIRPEFGDGQGRRRPTDPTQRTEMTAPGLTAKKYRKKGGPGSN